MLGMNRRNVLLATAASAVAMPFLNLRHAHAAQFTYKYASNVALDHPLTQGVVKAAVQIKQETGGRVEIQVFPNSQLGADMDMLTQVRTGAIEFYTMSGLLLASLVPVASINGIGFAFPDYPDVWKTMDGDLGAHVRSKIEKANVVVFDKIWNGGYRQITSSTKPINTPADLKGFKIRVPVSPLWTSMFKALGAAPASINWGEVYSSLQTKIVDGQETPLVSIESAKLYEVQKFCSMTNHMWDGFWFLANRRAWDALPADLRDIVYRNVNAAALVQREEVTRLNAELRSQLSARGLVFNDANTASFQDTLRQAGFYQEWKAKYGEEAWSMLETGLGKKLA
ncbi:TRAP transporter substrate-binding protein [Bradyrhizobium sp.]|uniref:TRAP transporter substrate-binding protein n=1 Tax=Bradyrhizobium sp. TaxID=376 RepID=UPI0040383ED7